MKNKLVICADDFGKSEGICHNIITLIKHHKINATSCMTNMPAWPKMSEQLLSQSHNCELGLHLNITEGPDKLHSLTTTLIKSCCRTIDKKAIRESFFQQMETFIHDMDRLPNYIDGHEHIHHFPVIRDITLELYHHYYPNKSAYIRVATNPLKVPCKYWRLVPKRWVIRKTGAIALRNMLKQQDIPYHHAFSGSYPFSQAYKYDELFGLFLSEVKGEGLIMCHPGDEGFRQKEFEVLMKQDSRLRGNDTPI